MGSVPGFWWRYSICKQYCWYKEEWLNMPDWSFLPSKRAWNEYTTVFADQKMHTHEN